MELWAVEVCVSLRFFFCVCRRSSFYSVQWVCVGLSSASAWTFNRLMCYSLKYILDLFDSWQNCWAPLEIDSLLLKIADNILTSFFFPQCWWRCKVFIHQPNERTTNKMKQLSKQFLFAKVQLHGELNCDLTSDEREISLTSVQSVQGRHNLKGIIEKCCVICCDNFKSS